jgi:hypothetical protein
MALLLLFRVIALGRKGAKAAALARSDIMSSWLNMAVVVGLVARSVCFVNALLQENLCLKKTCYFSKTG